MIPESEKEATWRHRENKRRTAVQAVKHSIEYATCIDRPPTPDPSERTLTKRKWEWRMRHWCRALRNNVALPPVDWLGGTDVLQGPFAPAKDEDCDESCLRAYDVKVMFKSENYGHTVQTHAPRSSQPLCFTRRPDHVDMDLALETCYELAFCSSSTPPSHSAMHTDSLPRQRFKLDEG